MSAEHGPRDLGERPEGPMSGMLHDSMLRLNVGKNHCFAEGYDAPSRAILTGYDRTEHPWMHGRRAHDLAAKVRGWLA